MGFMFAKILDIISIIMGTMSTIFGHFGGYDHNCIGDYVMVPVFKFFLKFFYGVLLAF